MIKFFQKFYSFIRCRFWWWNTSRTSCRLVSIYLKSPRIKETATEAVMLDKRLDLLNYEHTKTMREIAMKYGIGIYDFNKPWEVTCDSFPLR